MRRFFLLLFIAILVVSLLGTRWIALWEFVFGGISPLWRSVVIDLQWLDKQLIEWGMFPVGIALGLVGLIVTWMWPDIWDKIADYEKFLSRLIVVYQDNKGKFHHALNKAYKNWRQKQKDSNLADHLDELIDRTCPRPEAGFFSLRVSDVEAALSRLNPDLWCFCAALYLEVEETLADDEYEPTLLSREQCIEFSRARKNLVDFWNFEGRRIYSSIGRVFKIWTLPRIDEQLKDRSLIILPFLEAALAKTISRRMASEPLFELSARALKLWHAANT